MHFWKVISLSFKFLQLAKIFFLFAAMISSVSAAGQAGGHGSNIGEYGDPHVLLFFLIKYAYCEVNTQVVVEETPIQYAFQPFEFAYQSNDGQGTTQHRKEIADAKGTVKGAYGYLDPFGVYRAVEYVADDNGFRAIVKTNEPGTSNQNTGDALWLVQPPPSGLQEAYTTQGSAKQIPVPIKISPGNFTPAASSSLVSNAVFHVRPTIVQYPLPFLTRPGQIIFQVPTLSKKGNLQVFSRFPQKASKFTPRTEDAL
ncbi:uncharacterized protein LOC118198642 isoform X2 [Stegodyphus dumicola]|uniref:uncharacterized protein LOC118198642 isoform X2 n=1 Tax=Stegodyphus dumicola TaxID=202533 RepID=UPI0015ABA813|nr:uncharacterized protein LOC118198642 isoform X2 [Stegodyphus dumicola]